MTTSRITVFSPGHRPPQVTMAALVFAGSQNIFSTGPARTNARTRAALEE